MTRTTSEKIKVMQAYDRGEPVLFRMLGSPNGWHELTGEPHWNWAKFDYIVV